MSLISSARLRNVFVSSAVFGMATAASPAAILFYDGFTAGGATPAAGQYQSLPATATGGNTGDSLVRSAAGAGDGQMPATTGFLTGTGGGWRTTEGVATTVYGKIISTGLSYTGLTTAAGAVDIFRSGSNNDAATAQIKNYNRSLNAGLGAGATDLYFSALMQFDAGVRGQVGIVQAGTSSIVSFGFNDAGNVVVYGNTANPNPIATSALTYAALNTYMLVAHVSGNLIDIYLNPTSLTSEGASVGEKIISGIALTGFATGTAITDVRLTANTGNNINNPDFIIDELHGATTWADAFLAVPEASSASLVMAAGLLGLARRRRI